jgi:predicted membrane chloride channel (bestrophin family)
MQVIKNFLTILSYQTWIVMALSFLSTFMCSRYHVLVNLPTALISIAVVFPIVFSINAAYKRREEALCYFASIKSSIVALFYVHRDWGRHGQQEDSKRARELGMSLLINIQQYLTAKEHQQAQFQNIYHVFSQYSISIEKLRDVGLSGSETSRAQQQVRNMMNDFERMRNILIYRTPTSIRAYTQVFLNSFPILFGPYFAYIADRYIYAYGFFLAATYSLVLVGLDNIQDLLENPFDALGTDDIDLNVAELYRSILTIDNEEKVTLTPQIEQELLESILPDPVVAK